MLTGEQIRSAARDALIQASTTFRPDQVAAYRQALERETSARGRWVLEQILQNAAVAREKKYPLCDDTGIPHVILEIGERVRVNGKAFRAVAEGIAEGLRTLPGRPMAVRGDGLERLGQTLGMYDDPGMLEAAPVTVYSIPGNTLKITVLMLGGGPEIRGRTMRVFHRHRGENVIREAGRWAAEAAAALGCTPCVPIIGIGRTQYEAAALQLAAALEGDFTRQNPWEEEITRMVNETGVGPLGLGKTVTALGAFVKIGPARASGVRIVSLRLGCCFDPRRATVVLKDEGEINGEAYV
ncbi:fumarate hydratase [Desulfofundulus thermobenzoicus]|uniref:Fumarate hydratase n=1 Tax=Desulfofundulus thermobenzoicus TaxID=29376 RepID=A0A6N7ISW0_9FIRM|nr:fumarate hydratase [Desulfofundulus thermobenzoicus]MQL53142.1 fumarate hydratase [Desulfofundulus thermobenzoicus]